MQLSVKDYIYYHVVRGYPYQSVVERAYCEQMLRRRESIYERVLFWGSIFLCMVSIALTALANGDLVRSSIVYSSHSLILVSLGAWPLAKKLGVRLGMFMLPINIFCIASWATCIYLASGETATNDYYAPVAFTVLITSMLLAFPYSDFRLDIVAGIFMGICVAAYSHYTYMLPNISLAVATIFGASSFSRFRYRGARIAAIKHFREQARYFPRQVLWRGISENRPLDQVFVPENRTCVCISSDWRNYQALTANFTPKAIAQLLSDYYQMTDELLADCVPSGNYFCDWIADELFVVLFTDLPDGERFLWEQAVEFSSRLIARKAEFFVRQGAPEAIDIGLAGGQAFVGLMGPKGQGKTTALGEVPGKSRRVQTLGKELRAKFGEADRIIFATDLHNTLVGSHQIKMYELDDFKKIRNLEERRFFYIEPASKGVVTNDFDDLRKVL